MDEVYLDNGATTRPSEGVIKKMTEVLQVAYGNPSSLHRKGQQAEQYVKEARNCIAQALRVPDTTLYFTSGATESSNTAILGVASCLGKRGRHILTAKGEHPATSEPLARLQEKGFEIEYIDLDEYGRIRLESLEKKLRNDTILVTCLHVNNETGVIQPVDQMGEIIHTRSPLAVFHVDAVQSFGKLRLDPIQWKIDLMSTSAHKIHGPKGCGFLYIRRDLYLPSLLVGGGQERHFRSGTENVPGIAGYGEAVREAYAHREDACRHMQQLKERLYNGLTQRIDGITINGAPMEDSAPHVLNLRIRDVRSEVLLHALEEYGVYISSGSACSSNKPEQKSPALHALGLDAEAVDQSVRISFSRMNTEEDIDTCIAAMETVIPMLRRFTPKKRGNHGKRSVN